MSKIHFIYLALFGLVLTFQNCTSFEGVGVDPSQKTDSSGLGGFSNGDGVGGSPLFIEEDEFSNVVEEEGVPLDKPSELKGSLTDVVGEITWTWSPVERAIGYEIYVNDRLIGDVSELEYKQVNLADGNYKVYVVAYDKDENISERSDEVMVTIGPKVELEPTPRED